MSATTENVPNGVYGQGTSAATAGAAPAPVGAASTNFAPAEVPQQLPAQSAVAPAGSFADTQAAVPTGGGGGSSNVANPPPNTEGSTTPPVEIKLFVGRLPRTIDVNGVKPLFTPHGEVLEVIIIRDKATNMHKGSAFVRMASITQADASVRALHNIHVVDSQLGPLQVKYANGEAEKLGLTLDAANPGNDQAKLFVGSLTKTATDQDVLNLFSPYGKVDEIFIMKDAATNTSKGCAFVKMAYKEQALHAVRTLHGQYTMPGAPRPLEVRFAEDKRAQQANQRTGIAGGAVPGAAFGGMAAPGVAAGAPSNVNPRTVGHWKEYFTADGRPYYYNSIANESQWERPTEFDRPSAENTGPPGANVFIFHIPNEWTQQDLIAHFVPFGRILSAYIATDKATGRNKGYGFVSFDNVNSAVQAVTNMHGFSVGGGSKRLKVSIKTGEEKYVTHLLNAQAAAPAGAGVPGVAGLPAPGPAGMPMGHAGAPAPGPAVYGGYGAYGAAPGATAQYRRADITNQQYHPRGMEELRPYVH